MHRRRFLAASGTLVAAALGGCTGTPRASRATLEMTAVSDLAIARRATPNLNGTAAQDVVADAVENGSATVVDDVANTPENRPPAVPTNTSLVRNQSVHRLSRTVVDAHPVTVYHYTIDPPEGDVADEASVRYDALPAVDRRKLAMPDPSIIGFTTTFHYTTDQRDRSALVPEPDRPVIVWGPDTRGRITIEDSFETEVRTYRYTASTVRESAAAYGAEVRSAHAFTLTGLSPAARDIVERAIDDPQGYEVPDDEPVPDALDALTDRFRGHEPVSGARDSVSGEYVLRYDGTVYWARLSLRT